MTTTSLTLTAPQLRNLSDYQIKGALFSPTELVIEDGISEAEWMKMGRTLAHVCQAASWWAADFVAYGEKTYGKETAYDLAQQTTVWSRQYLYRVVSIARRFPPETRLPALSFFHYQ